MARTTRPPQWWLDLISLIPQLELPALEPKAWTPELAQKWIRLVPAKCPFEREWRVRGRLLFYIPPLCPLNPFSTQLYKIRIQAQQYLLWQHDTPDPWLE